MLTLVTVIYGNDRRYRVELFGSVLSILKMREHADTRVVVYTDRTLDDFPLPITERVIKTEEWDSWTRGSGITHLVKLHLVRQTLDESSGPVIYFDTDTLFLASPEKIAARLSPATALMHAAEGPIAGHDIWTNIAGWLDNGREVCGITLSRQSPMYNSGIVGVVPEHRDALVRSVDIADALYEVDPVFSLDQFSTSCALSHQAEVETCEQDVLHYWGWNRAFLRDAIDTFWQQHADVPLVDIQAAFEPTSYIQLPSIHWRDKLHGRYMGLRFQLDPDSRFACIALSSAMRNIPNKTHAANNWFSVHIGFLERLTTSNPHDTEKLQTILKQKHESCRDWLSSVNAASLDRWKEQ